MDKEIKLLKEEVKGIWYVVYVIILFIIFIIISINL